MTTEEIEKAVKDYTESLKSIAFENLSGGVIPYLLRGAFREGFESANKHWQEKTRWKSLEKEPPTTFGERVQILLKNKHSELSLAPVYSDRSIEDYLDYGFIEWKEIE